MKALIVSTGRSEGTCQRFLRLAEFLGVTCELLELPHGQPSADSFSALAAEPGSYLVLHPATVESCIRPDELDGFAADLLGRFQKVVILGLRHSAYDSAWVRAFSGGQLTSVEPIRRADALYSISADARDVCEAFAGLTFGPVEIGNDRILVASPGAPVRPLISVDGLPLMASVKNGSAEILFIAGEALVDLDAPSEAWSSSEHEVAPSMDGFSRFIPQAMAIRYMAGSECWRPKTSYAAIIIDDPLLTRSYGYLNFDELLADACRHNYHAVIAFIPHNSRRNSPRILREFQNNPERLSICFHGNDHTDAEFAGTNSEWLNTLLQVAEDRIASMQATTGLECDRIMVFPQGKFSAEAMNVLKMHNFHAAVNTTAVPLNQPVQLTHRELAAPAILRYGGFPLFLRVPIEGMEDVKVAYNLFFGQPVLIVEHHEIFKRPEAVTEIANRINSICPQIRWSNLATIAANSILTRPGADGEIQVRAYTGAVRLENDGDCVRIYKVQWPGSTDASAIEQVRVDGVPRERFEVGADGLEVNVELPPASARTVEIAYRNPLIARRALGGRWRLRAFLRRRLSEFRDNYLSKNERLMGHAKRFQSRFLKV